MKMRYIMKIQYQCEICGMYYDDQQTAEKCESRGIGKPLLNIGDITTICDCNKTPIMYMKYRNIYPRYDIGICIPKPHVINYIERICDRKIKCRLAFIESYSPHEFVYIFYTEEEPLGFRIKMFEYQLKDQLKYYNQIESGK